MHFECISITFKEHNVLKELVHYLYENRNPIVAVVNAGKDSRMISIVMMAIGK